MGDGWRRHWRRAQGAARLGNQPTSHSGMQITKRIGRTSLPSAHPRATKKRIWPAPRPGSEIVGNSRVGTRPAEVAVHISTETSDAVQQGSDHLDNLLKVLRKVTQDRNQPLRISLTKKKKTPGHHHSRESTQNSMHDITRQKKMRKPGTQTSQKVWSCEGELLATSNACLTAINDRSAPVAAAAAAATWPLLEIAEPRVDSRGCASSPPWPTTLAASR